MYYPKYIINPKVLPTLPVCSIRGPFIDVLFCNSLLTEQKSIIIMRGVNHNKAATISMYTAYGNELGDFAPLFHNGCIIVLIGERYLQVHHFFTFLRNIHKYKQQGPYIKSNCPVVIYPDICNHMPSFYFYIAVRHTKL